MRDLTPSLTVCSLLVAAFAFAGVARAEGVLGPYIGAAVGQARIRAAAPLNVDFSDTHSSFKLFAGIRPLSLVGAEVSYFDFGHPSDATSLRASDVEMNGASAMGMLFLPVPIIDIYAKAGIARIRTSAKTETRCPAVCVAPLSSSSITRTDTKWAGGAGVQLKVSSLSIRGEYERFNAADEHPALWSLGVAWSF